MPMPRRFLPPRTIDEHDETRFIVADSDGQELAYVYFEDEPADGPRPSCSARMRPGASL
jgi:hypothetical protein